MRGADMERRVLYGGAALFGGTVRSRRAGRHYSIRRLGSLPECVKKKRKTPGCG